MSVENEKKKTNLIDWLNTLPGIITSIAAVLTAAGSLIVILNQDGLIVEDKPHTEKAITETGTTITGTTKTGTTEKASTETATTETDTTATVSSQSFVPNNVVSITSVGNHFYFFKNEKDNMVYYSKGLLGGGVSAWQKVDGNVTAASAPSAGAVNNQIFVAVRGTDNHIYLNQATNGNSFNNFWEDTGFETDVTPAVIGVQNYLYIFAKNLEDRIFFNRALLGSKFEGWKEMEGNVEASANSSPSVGAIGNYMYVLIKGRDNNVWLNQGATDGTFQAQWQSMNFITNASPVSVGVGKYIYFFVIDTNGQVNYNYSELGGGGHGWKMFSENNPYAKAVTAGAVGNGYLFIMIEGKDEKHYLNQGDILSSFNKWAPF